MKQQFEHSVEQRQCPATVIAIVAPIGEQLVRLFFDGAEVAKRLAECLRFTAKGS